jgi:asparagine synthase (glutamine-hydrolysing)
MIHFRAYANNAPEETIPDLSIQRWSHYDIFPELSQRWIFARGNVFMQIQGDCELSGFTYNSPRLALICHTDLLGTDTCGDFIDANRNPARYLAQLYELKGDAFIRNLHGWFGIMLYDLKQNTLKAWTDHHGVRRIVYKEAGGALGIASDLRILNNFFDTSPEIEPQAVVDYFQHSCIPAPRTIYKDTLRLQPGHLLVSRPGVTSYPYWDMTYNEKNGLDPKTWASKTYDEIHSAVARAAKRSDEDSGLGCFLSGGTDSSSVSGLVGRITREAPKTFSIGFDDARYNEIEYARIAARKFEADHHEYFVTPEDILSLIPKADQAYDEPFGNSSIIPSYYCAKLAVEAGVRYLLAGDGGDELFGGNERYVKDRIFQHYSHIPVPLRKLIIDPAVHTLDRFIPLAVFKKADSYIRRASIPVPDRYFSYSLPSVVPPGDIFADDFLSSLEPLDLLGPARSHFHHAQADNDLNRYLYLDLKLTINDNDLRKVTQMAELAGAGIRYPLLDLSLTEFSGTIPSTLKVHRNTLRYIFKKAMADLLPIEIIQKSKHGFGLPYCVWLNEHPRLKQFTFDILGSSNARRRGILHENLLDLLWDGYEKEHQIFYGEAIWMFLMFELWCRRSL